MINPTTEDIGRSVTYFVPKGFIEIAGKPVRLKCPKEFGVISSFNALYVFVLYGSNTTAKATIRQDLEWGIIHAVRQDDR